MIGCLLEFKREKTSCGYQLLHTRSNFSKSVMVSFGMSSLGCTQVIFIDPGVKNNDEYYRDVLHGEHCCLRLKNYCRAVNCSDSITIVLLLIESKKLLINRLLTMLSMNVESALEHAFELMAGIFNISFKEQQLIG